MRTAFGVELAISPVTSPSLSAKAAAEHTEELPGVEATYELAGGFSSDAVDPMRGISLERDHLGMRPYVTMLATVIADRRTAMPLSVGLFGEWGSGKSYFMGLLRQQVNQLSESGRPHYLGNIAQIGFNAWHYADTNLWASLGDEIFEQLAGPRASVDEQRDKLRAKLAETLQRRRELQAATAQAQQETARLSAAIEKASDDKRRSTRALVAAAARSETVQEQLDEAFKQLGVNDEAEQGRLLADELRTSAPDFDALRHLATGRRARALAGLAAVGLLLLAAGALVGDELGRLLAGGGLASVLGLLAAALTVAARMRSGLRLLSQAASEITADIEAHPGRAVADQLNVLRRAEADERILQAQLDEVVGHVGELGRELAALSPGHRLYRFVSDRADSDRYGQHLGLISTVRKDFEQLTELMDEWRKHPGSDPDAPRAIDRIVLYIDDLDRCSTRQVVEVLQAVHLLLALELFVVVVGVDPRWLLRSLQREYPDQLVGDGPDAHGWDASPQDYLEKIFNIPFALPAMSPDTFRVLLDGLTSEEEPVDNRAAHTDASSPGEPEASASLPASTASPSAARDRGAGTDAHAPAVADIPIEPESVIASIMRGEPDIEVRQLTDAELLLLASLAPLVQTPREAKRLINLYRMVRSATSLSPAADFLAGEYQAVAVLLGLLSGHRSLLQPLFTAEPDPAARVLGGVLGRNPTTSWATFVEGIAPRQDPEGWRNDVVGAMSQRDAGAWRQLADALSQSTPLVTLGGLRAFQLWAPRIARFSFLLSPHAMRDSPPPNSDDGAPGSYPPSAT